MFIKKYIKYLISIFLIISISFGQYRPVMGQYFTSSSCLYGPEASESIYKLQDELGRNKLILAEYHPLNEPGNFSLTANTDSMYSIYDITYVPSLKYDSFYGKSGGYEGVYYDYYDFFKLSQRDSSWWDSIYWMDIDIKHDFQNDTIFANIDVEIPREIRTATGWGQSYFNKVWEVYIHLTEDNIKYSGFNGQDLFRHVVRDMSIIKFVPSADTLYFNTDTTFSIKDTFLLDPIYNIKNLNISCYIRHRPSTGWVYLSNSGSSQPMYDVRALPIKPDFFVSPNKADSKEVTIYNDGSMDDSYSLNVNSSKPNVFLPNMMVNGVEISSGTSIDINSGDSLKVILSVSSLSNEISVGQISMEISSQNNPGMNINIEADCSNNQISLNQGNWPVSFDRKTSNGSVFFIDIDKDGDFEITTHNGSHYSIYDHKGNVVKGPYDLSYPGYGSYLQKPNEPFAIGDVDGDGELEAVGGVGHYSTFAIINFNTDVIDFAPFDVPYKHKRDVVLGDVNNDGKDEIIFLNDITEQGNWVKTELYVVDNDFNVLPGWPVDIEMTWALPIVGDINNDNLSEIIIGTTSQEGYSRMYVFKKDGTHLPGWPQDVEAAPRGNDRYLGMGATTCQIIVDLNNDGIKEIVVGNSLGNKVYAFQSDGSQLAGWPITLDSPVLYIAAGDLNNNGKNELVVLSTNANLGYTGSDQSKVYVYNSNGALLSGWPVLFPGNTFNAKLVSNNNININYQQFNSLNPFSQKPITGEMSKYFSVINNSYQLNNITETKSASTWFFFYSPPTIANVDQDPYLEIIFSVASNIVALNIDGSIVDDWPIMLPTKSFLTASPAIKDLDGDGKLDLCFIGYDNDRYLYNFEIPNSNTDNNSYNWPVFLHDFSKSGNFDYLPKFGLNLNTEDNISVPLEFSLKQNYPNPFNPSTNIKFVLPETGKLTLKIFNILGQLVSTPVDNKNYEAGMHSINLDLSSETNGIYFYTLETDNWTDTKKMVYLK